MRSYDLPKTVSLIAEQPVRIEARAQAHMAYTSPLNATKSGRDPNVVEPDAEVKPPRFDPASPAVDGKDVDVPCWALPNWIEVSGARDVLSVARPIATRRMITSGLMHCNGGVNLQACVPSAPYTPDGGRRRRRRRRDDAPLFD